VASGKVVVDASPLYYYLLSHFDRTRGDAPKKLLRQMMSDLSDENLAQIEAQVGGSQLVTTPAVIAEADRRIRMGKQQRTGRRGATPIHRALRESLLDLLLELRVRELIMPVQEFGRNEWARVIWNRHGPVDITLVLIAEQEEACLITADRRIAGLVQQRGGTAIYVRAPIG